MKNVIRKHPIAAAIGIGVALAVVLTMMFAGHTHGPDAKSETVYERVMRTGTLRCGYFSWKPFLIKDPNTGALSGIFYDYVNAIPKKLSLKVEWAQEMGLGEFSAALDSGIVDGFCSGAYITGARARAVDFVSPAFYVPLYAFERADDTRFDHGIDALDDSQFRMAILEGGVTDTIQKQQFPKTTTYALPQLTSPAELFMNVTQNKADFTVYDLATYGDFNAHNPGKIRRIADQPVKVFPLSIAIKPDEDRFRQMLSHATSEVQLSGEMEKIIRKYEAYPGSFYSVRQPYQQ